MFQKKKINVDEMTLMELEALHDRVCRRVLLLNGLWLLFVVAMIFVWFHAGIILAVLTVLKYWYDYHDTESQGAYSSFLALLERKQTKERRSDD